MATIHLLSLHTSWKGKKRQSRGAEHLSLAPTTQCCRGGGVPGPVRPGARGTGWNELAEGPRSGRGQLGVRQNQEQEEERTEQNQTKDKGGGPAWSGSRRKERAGPVPVGGAPLHCRAGASAPGGPPAALAASLNVNNGSHLSEWKGTSVSRRPKQVDHRCAEKMVSSHPTECPTRAPGRPLRRRGARGAPALPKVAVCTPGCLGHKWQTPVGNFPKLSPPPMSLRCGLYNSGT